MLFQQKFYPKRLIRHPKYAPGTGGTPYDIALIDLDFNVDLEFNPGIDTIALPQQDEYFVGNPDCWITGYGQTNGKDTKYLQEAHVDVYSKAKGTFTLCPCQNPFQYPLQFPCPSHRLHWIRIPVSFRLNFMSTTASPDVKVWFCIGTCKIRMETDVRISFSRSGDRSKRNGR